MLAQLFILFAASSMRFWRKYRFFRPKSVPLLRNRIFITFRASWGALLTITNFAVARGQVFFSCPIMRDKMSWLSHPFYISKSGNGDSTSPQNAVVDSVWTNFGVIEEWPRYVVEMPTSASDWKGLGSQGFSKSLRAYFGAYAPSRVRNDAKLWWRK